MRMNRFSTYISFAVVMVLVLAACSPPSIVPDFSVAVSGVLSIQAGSSDQVTVTLSRSGGFADVVTMSVEGLPGGVTAAFSENPLAGSSASLTLSVSPSSAVGAFALTVRGQAGSLSKTASLNLSVTGPPVTVNSVAVQGFSPSKQVRQGYGTIVLEVLGDQLSDIALAKLGSLNGTVVTNNSISATISFLVSHGADMGMQTLSLTASAGAVDFPGAVEITAITADANTGVDTNQGTLDSPFKTLTQAASVASLGDSIHLADGLYDNVNGEAFPVTISGVSLSGASEAGTILDDNSGVTDTLVAFSGPTSVSDLTISNVGEAIDFNGGDATISNVTVDTTTVDAGMELSGSGTFTLTNITVMHTTGEGIDLFQTATATIAGATLDGNVNHAVLLRDSASLDLSDATFVNNERNSIRLEGANTLNLMNSSFTNNGVLGAWSATVLFGNDSVTTIDNVTVDANGAYGINFGTSNGSLTVTDATITNQGLSGINVSGSPLVINLGDAVTPGNNVLTGNGGFQLRDVRPAGETVIMTAYSDDLGGVGAQPTGIKVGAASEAARWSISGAGNQIDFGP